MQKLIVHRYKKYHLLLFSLLILNIFIILIFQFNCICDPFFHYFSLKIKKKKIKLPDFLFKKYDLKYEFWKELNTLNTDDINEILDILFPNVANSNNLNNFNEKEFIFDQKISLLDEYVDKHQDWPDESYNWEPPRNQKVGKVIIPGIKDIQYLIWKHQHPMSCSNKKVLVVPQFTSGFGSCLHMLSAYLSEALNKNKILVWGEASYAWDIGPYCHDYESDIQRKYIKMQEKRKIAHNQININYTKYSEQKGFDCFFNLLSNCSIDSENIEAEYIFTILSEKIVPDIIMPIVEKLKIPENLVYFYWRLCSTAYLVRYNEQAKDWMKELENDYLINPVDNYDVSIYVRHGDKDKEMNLVSNEQYMSALSIIQKILNKKQLNIFLSTEDPNTIEWFTKHTNYSITYFNFVLENIDLIKSMELGSVLTQQMLANLKHSLFSKYVIGTLSSNWNRLILELRMTTAGYANNYYFEVGDHICVSLEHCKLLNEKFHTNW